MDFQLTFLLVLVGLIIIGFIYFDAKRRSKVRREKVEREFYEQKLDSQKDNTGFDEDGIGTVRVVNHGEEPKLAYQADSVDIDELIEEKIIDKSIEGSNGGSEKHLEPVLDETDIPVLDDALFEFKSESFKTEKKEPKVDSPQQTSLFEDKDEPSVEVEPELIISLFVVSGQDKPFLGPELVQTLVEQGMRHGDMDIFHRHSQATGRGPIQFSLANAFEPGVFKLDDVDSLQTKGLAMFMALPGPKQPLKAYELMVKTAKAITEQLGGYVLDSSKSNFSKQIEAHHIQQIQEFERKQLLNKH